MEVGSCFNFVGLVTITRETVYCYVFQKKTMLRPSISRMLQLSRQLIALASRRNFELALGREVSREGEEMMGERCKSSDVSSQRRTMRRCVNWEVI